MRRGLSILAAPVLVATLAPDAGAATRRAPWRLERHLGRGQFVPADGRGVVSLRTTDHLVTACEAWGAASCR